MKKGKLTGIGMAALMAFLLVAALPATAETTQEEMLRLMQEMNQKMNNLQQQVQDLQQRNAYLEQRLSAQEKINSAMEERIEEIEPVAASASSKSVVSSKYPVDLYGYFKFDASYDTDKVNVGNFARWVESGETNEDDNQFNATANQSRFGLKFNGPDFGEGKTRGQVEVDFYGGGDENKSRVRMRLAYLELLWPEYDFSILAGQQWDVVSPLVPTTLNFLAGNDAGNIGYRRPQFRLTKGFDLTEDVKVQFQVAAARTIGDNSLFGTTWDTGEESGFPSLQGRAAVSFPLLTEKKTTIGISGHYGEEEVDIDLFDNNVDLDTWSGVLDLTLPIADWLTFKGELWTGENLDSYRGGIGQGVNTTTGQEIAAQGGWGAFTIDPAEEWQFNLGAAFDDPDDDDLPSGGRDLDTSYWVNALYDVNEAVQVGLEISYWDTEYVDLDDGESLRFQTSLIYKF